jgi:paired amphipathic helix protein Sin3a
MELTFSRIDTPGVIDRVSNLFKGHPALIQGFNTFLPPGYRIECFKERDGKDMITVTTPRGTISQTAGSFTASALSGNRDKPTPETSRDGVSGPASTAAAASRPVTQAPSSRLSAAPPTLSSTTASQPPVPALPQTAPAPMPNPHHVNPAPTHLTHNVVDGVPILRPPHELAVVKAKALAQGLPDPTATTGASAIAAAESSRETGQIESEFNHAITYVNKIKSRYKDKPDTYKQFLEILQTYQKDGRAITEVSLLFTSSNLTDVQVYEQVSTLFVSAPDLIGEFKQFLPDDSRDSAVFSSLMIADRAYVQPTAGSKRAGASKESNRKKRGPAGEAKPSKVCLVFSSRD